jgi:Ciliary BBSome complex subunit 2, C-terminal
VANRSLELEVKISKSGWIIKTAIGTNEALFEGGSFVEYPAKSTNEVRFKMFKEKNTEEAVSVKVLISQGANAPHFLIHEEILKL